VKRAVIVFASACTLLAVLVAPRLLQRFCSQVFPLARDTQSRYLSTVLPFYERAVFLNVYRDGRTLSCISCSTRAIFLTVTSEICIRILVFDLKVFMSLAML